MAPLAASTSGPKPTRSIFLDCSTQRSVLWLSRFVSANSSLRMLNLLVLCFP
ncbi:hypothetical protein ACFPRL_26615 [Pseudoclavibacter helvolus]